MSWETILEKDQLELRCDEKNKNIIMEVNSSGFMPDYVTLHLDKADALELIEALKRACDKVFGNELIGVNID